MRKKFTKNIEHSQESHNALEKHLHIKITEVQKGEAIERFSCRTVKILRNISK